MASNLYEINENISEYFKDRKVDENKLKTSTTLYIGNLSFFTIENQIYELFSMCGAVNRIIMGLNKNTKTPCGFCFVEYFDSEDAGRAINLLNNTYLDNRIIRVDRDPGFVEGRQFGRGYSGGQKRDELNEKVDPDRPKDNRFTGNKKRYRDNRERDSYRDNRDSYKERDNTGNRDRDYSRGYDNRDRERGNNNRDRERGNSNRDRDSNFFSNASIKKSAHEHEHEHGTQGTNYFKNNY